MTEPIQLDDFDGRGETRGVLAHLWRHALFMHEVNAEKWAQLLDAYVQRKANSPEERELLRAQLTKELFDPYLSEGSFLKGLDLLRVRVVHARMTMVSLDDDAPSKQVGYDFNVQFKLTGF